MNVKQVKDSENRCGVFIGFCLKPTHIQGSYNSLSSVFRLLLIEAITFPFHLQKSKYSLSISLSPRSIFCNNRLLRNFLLSPSTLYGPTLYASTANNNESLPYLRNIPQKVLRSLRSSESACSNVRFFLKFSCGCTQCPHPI